MSLMFTTCCVVVDVVEVDVVLLLLLVPLVVLVLELPRARVEVWSVTGRVGINGASVWVWCVELSVVDLAVFVVDVVVDLAAVTRLGGGRVGMKANGGCGGSEATL